MNTNYTELDPLSEYDYSYGAYNHLYPNNMYPYPMKMEPLHHQSVIQSLPNPLETPMIQNLDTRSTEPNNDQQVNIAENNPDLLQYFDSKEDIKPIINPKRTKERGRKSSYWNKKITDTNFPFYGCTICNISFTTITDLDHHVTVHKGRLTSYDLRLKNQLKKKLLKKEQKKLKKLGKNVKRENITPDIEIKPEDGYIGNEKASDFINNDQQTAPTSQEVAQASNVEANTCNEVTQENNTNKNEDTKDKDKNVKDKSSKSNDSSTKGNKIMEQYKEIMEPEDPRLHKLFKCFACEKQFSLSYYLKLHVRSHTDEKPYTCAECGQSFITASKLGRHNKRIHLAVRYQCRICYRYFSRFELLTRHFDKKHSEDKLEGEPYDYNAILPYLKELEEELREKSEAKDEKPKTEDLWSDWSGMDQLHQSFVDPKKEGQLQSENAERSEVAEEKTFLQPMDIMVEEVKVDYEPEIKKEQDSDAEDPVDTAPSAADEDDVKDPGVKDDSTSDDDYFPSNTWAATPKIELGPLSPPRRRLRKKDFPQKCELCDKVINSASYMKVHLRTHTGERPFKCYICGRGFITSSKMHRHVLTHTETWADGEDIKPEDRVKMEDEEAEGEEEDSAEGTEKSKKHKTSGKKGKSTVKKPRDGVRRRREYQRRPFVCPFCSKRFLHQETLNVHKKSHDGEKVVLKCNFCLEEMPDEEALGTHEATHTGPKPYLCTICGRSYTKKETMVYHRKNHNPEQSGEKKEFLCNVCSKSFNAQCKLQRHIVGHRVDKFVLRYECPVCAHMFNTKYHIQMHLSTHQKEGLILEENRNEILAMVLQNARKIPKKTDTPITAIDLIPSDERSRVCNICGQVFQHFYYLEEHLKSHGSKIAIEDETKAEEKKHICQVCNKGFKLHYYLKLHLFTHTKEKPFICQQCGKGFITKGKLKRHLETHTGLKKYQCHICYKFFTRPSYLRIHVRTIHGTQDYNFRVWNAPKS